MDEVTSRKLEALDKKQDIDRLVELYTEFQAYIEELARCVKSSSASPEPTTICRSRGRAAHTKRGLSGHGRAGYRSLNLRPLRYKSVAASAALENFRARYNRVFDVVIYERDLLRGVESES